VHTHAISNGLLSQEKKNAVLLSSFEFFSYVAKLADHC
jgi:hypothetical protein